MIKVYDITILTDKEYTIYRFVIPSLHDKQWWLINSETRKAMIFMPKTGRILDQSKHPQHEYRVRPALYVEPIDNPIGDCIKIFGKNWTVLNKEKERTLVLCDSCDKFVKFDNNDVTFEESHLMKYLKRWLKEEQKKQAEKEEKMIQKAGSIKKYQNSYFIKYWLMPICISIPIAVVLGIFCYLYPDAYPIWQWAIWALRFISMAIAIIGVGRVVLIVNSPHPDTWLLNTLNIAFLAGMIKLTFDLNTFPSFFLLSTAIIMFLINYNYLKHIKYYS